MLDNAAELRHFAPMTHFGDRLIDAVRAHGPLCVGLDPYAERIPKLFGDPGPEAVGRFSEAVVARLAGRVAVIKPQIALFEKWGPAGLAVLADLVGAARDLGLIVILDAKRGDIGATASGYAQAYLGPDAWLPVDAVTVNPYMGLDTLAPWLELADAAGRGVVVLARTSNPGAADLQDLDAGGAPVWERVAAALRPLVDARVGESGWSSVMAVVGATAPDEARRARALLPAAPFLVPGYGAQGATAADALAGGRGGDGVVVNSSRAVLYSRAAAEAGDMAAWSNAFDAAVETAKSDLAAASA